MRRNEKLTPHSRLALIGLIVWTGFFAVLSAPRLLTHAQDSKRQPEMGGGPTVSPEKGYKCTHKWMRGEMNIGIIGAGNLGTGLAKQLVKKGHAVMLSFSKDLAKLRNTAVTLGAQSGTPAEAAAFADVIVLATPWSATGEALKQIGTVQGRKLIWDCTNALTSDMSGLLIGTTTSGGEEVAKLAPWAKVVKAIPPFAEVLHSPSTLVGGAPPGVFVCADDLEARNIIAGLVEDVGGAPVDSGPLNLARYTEPAAMLLVQLAYTQGFGPRIGLTLARDASQSALKVATP